MMIGRSEHLSVESRNPLGVGSTLPQRLLSSLGPVAALVLLLIALSNRLLGTTFGGSLSGVLLPIAVGVLVALIVESLVGEANSPAWRRRLAALGAGLLGSTLLVGAWSKVLDPAAFEQTLVAEGLDFLPVFWLALVALALEVGLGAALVLGVRSRLVLIASTGLVSFFLFLTGRAYWRFANGIVVEDTSCGCFGNLVVRTPAEAFWQDLLMLVPGLLLAFLVVSLGRRPALRWVLVIALAVGAVAFGVAAPDLPLDDLATRLSPGSALEDFCAGEGDTRLCMATLKPELKSGEHLVVLGELENEEFVAAVGGLSAWVIEDRQPPLTVWVAATPEQIQTFFWTQGPAFELGEAPEALLRPLYRRLPRSFKLVDGIVTETWAGLPDLPEPVEPIGEFE